MIGDVQNWGDFFVDNAKKMLDPRSCDALFCDQNKQRTQIRKHSKQKASAKEAPIRKKNCAGSAIRWTTVARYSGVKLTENRMACAPCLLMKGFEFELFYSVRLSSTGKTTGPPFIPVFLLRYEVLSLLVVSCLTFQLHVLCVYKNKKDIKMRPDISIIKMLTRSDLCDIFYEYDRWTPPVVFSFTNYHHDDHDYEIGETLSDMKLRSIKRSREITLRIHRICMYISLERTNHMWGEITHAKDRKLSQGNVHKPDRAA